MQWNHEYASHVRTAHVHGPYAACRVRSEEPVARTGHPAAGRVHRRTGRARHPPATGGGRGEAVDPQCRGCASALGDRALRGGATLGPDADRGGHAVQAPLGAGVYSGGHLWILGVVRPGNPGLLAAAPRPAALRLRATHSADLVPSRPLWAGFWPCPDHGQLQPVHSVQTAVVLLAVRDRRARLPRQGVDPLAEGRALGAHLQSLLLWARRVLGGADPDGGPRT